MRLRILLPPTLAGCIQRNAIPAKIELEDDSGTRIPPEKCKVEDLGSLPDAERSALFVLSQWCGGKLTSFLQLNIEQAAELLNLLDRIECFFPANSPEQAISWTKSGPIGVSDHIGKPSPKQPPKKIRELKPIAKESKNEDSITEYLEYKGPPIEVE